MNTTPIGITLNPSFNPDRDRSYHLWIHSFRYELKETYGLYKKDARKRKDEIIEFKDFCLIMFKNHRDIIEPNLN